MKRCDCTDCIDHPRACQFDCSLTSLCEGCLILVESEKDDVFEELRAQGRL